MGRVSRYKKVKSVDPFAKNGSWKSDVGDLSTIRRVKRKSKTALKMKEQKMNKQRRMRGKQDADSKRGGGSNGFGDEDGYDLPPDGGDEFDMNDLMGSVKKQRLPKSNPLLGAITEHASVKPSGGDEKLTRKVDKVVAAQGGNGNSAGDNTQNGKGDKSSKAQVKYDGTQKITSRTSTREIIAACSNPKSQKKVANNDSAGPSKQEKRKAYLDKKKLRKRKRRKNALDSDDEEEYNRQQALKSLHSQSQSASASSSAQQPKQAKTKKHTVKQQNYTETMVARTVMDDQVERPPTFTTLPRGANKLAKNKKKTKNDDGDSGLIEDDDAKAQRIRKEQQNLEAMRKRVMQQYAVLRESRRSGR